jgi:CRP-like cAMP-binding protein
MPDVQVATLYEGDFFGEMTLLIGEKRSASVIAVEGTECIKISKYALLPLLIARADVGLSIAQLITDRQLENRREIGQSLGNSEEAAKELSEVISSNYDIDNLIQLFATVPVFSELTKQQELLRTGKFHLSLNPKP